MNAGRSHVRIRSIGLYMPSTRVSNYEKAEKVGFERDFLEHKLGVVARSVMEPGETTSDLAIRAFNALAERSELPRDEIQLLVVVTQHPDFKVPHTAALVHNRLELAKPCMTFDISQGCAGYTHAVTIVTGVMDAANLNHGVLITSDPYSDKVADDDRDVSLLFGDAATATYFSRWSRLPADRLELRHAAGQLPLSDVPRPAGDGRCGRVQARRARGPSEHEGITRAQPAECRRYRYISAPSGLEVSRRVRQQKDASSAGKAPFEASNYGNTVSSSIPLMLQKHVDATELERIVLSGFGVGFTWGNNLLQRSKAEV